MYIHKDDTITVHSRALGPSGDDVSSVAMVITSVSANALRLTCHQSGRDYEIPMHSILFYEYIGEEKHIHLVR